MKARFYTLVLVCLALSVGTALGQGTVKGTITSSEDGQGIPGATVAVKGTTTGTVTGGNGTYSINVPANATLVYSYVGFKSKEVVVGNQSVINVTLSPDIEQLGQVVVTALGITREKKSLGYAVSEVGNDEITRSGEVGVIQSLNAKVPGMQVISSGGTPGASAKVLIRGASTFSGETQPLIVIDGIPIDNSTTQSQARDYPFNENLQGVNNSNRAIDINPDDIESVTVLKGPAAAALYGERAGNGAILYTTKRGKMGKRGLGVKVGSSIEFTTYNKMPDKQNTYGLGRGGVSSGFADPGPDGIGFNADDVSFGDNQSWGPRLDTTNKTVYDPYDFFQTGMAWRNSVEVAGGTESSSIRLGIGDLRQTGIVPGTEFNRTSVRITGDAKLSSRVKVGGTANYIRSSQVAAQNGSNLAGIMLGLVRAPVDYDLSDYVNDQGFQKTYFVLYDNPYYTAERNPFTSAVDRFLGNTFLNWQISDDFNFTYRIGADAYADDRQQIFAISSFGDDIGSVGQINENRLNSLEIYADAVVGYSKNLSDNFRLNARLGHNMRHNKFDDLFGRGRSLTIPDFYNLNNASDLYSSRFSQTIRSQALFGELGFDYDGWLYVNLTGRNEWSSTFELENNNFFYPSASASVVFSEVLDLPTWLSFGKIRYSYAQVGISPQAYATRPLYTSPTYTDGFTNGLSVPYNGVNGFAISETLFGSDLRPEIQTGNEVGINLNFREGLVDIDYTFFNQKSSDLLLSLPRPGSSGFQAQYSNFGEMVNKGHELYISSTPVRGDDFSWTIGLNWYKLISEVTALADGVEEVSLEAAFTSIGSFAIVGEPLGVFYGTQWTRNDAGELLINANGLPGIEPSAGNIGNPIPNWTAGLRNSFDYKDFSLSFLFDFRNGGGVYNGTLARLNNLGVSGESADRTEGRTIEGVYAPGTVIDGEDVSGQTNTTEIDARTYWRAFKGDAGGAAEERVEDVNWVRLRDISLNYRLDLGDKNWGINYINFNATGRNVWLNTNYKGVDPETSLTGAGSNINGLDYFNNPGTKSYMFGVSFGF